MKNSGFRSLTSVWGVRVLAVLFTVALTGCATSGGGASNPAVGTWDVTVDSPAGVLEMAVTIAPDMSGTISVADQGEPLDVENAVLEGQTLTFGVTFDFQGTELAAKFVGVIDGDTITGEIQTDFGNAEATGTRVQ
jgi:hypothetical protein